ncbi:hypothetical protein NDN08_000325 [Rhodosorus marinus]|uniref:Uncharacterized protein n=1 Tax=Rhodosorus marinus TaxID=101924 RepID=A0AAV8URN4_9RHOD|nr:hypothetical protein NDN08_000325 [Rhodosorus marinus]
MTVYKERKWGSWRALDGVWFRVCILGLLMMLYVWKPHKIIGGIVFRVATGPELTLTKEGREQILNSNIYPPNFPDEERRSPRIETMDGVTCRIPKILHQTYKTKDADKWPVREWVRYRDSWRNNHPASEGWSMKLWTDEDNLELVTKYYPEYLDLYKAIKLGVSRADFARMLYMHLHGGIYADMDVASAEPLEVFFNESYEACVDAGVIMGHMGEEDGSDSIPNAFIMSEPGHPLWRYCIESAPTSAITVEARYGPTHIKRCVKAFTDNPVNEGTRISGGLLNEGSEKGGAVFLASTVYFYPYSWANLGMLPFCDDYRFALGKEDYVDDDLRGKCESELKEFADHSVVSAARTAPITYTMWCHSWGQFFERNKVTYKIAKLLRAIHPRLAHF